VKLKIDMENLGIRKEKNSLIYKKIIPSFDGQAGYATIK